MSGKPITFARFRPRWWRWFLALTSLALVVTGCKTAGYYRQAVSGQMEILSKRQDIQKILARPDTRPALREKLTLVQELRAFASRELGLESRGHYSAYADLGRRYVVWNVYAAPEFSLEPKKWWYPIVGSLKYRGFFSEKQARDHAAELVKQGYDVHVAGIDAYSTLGFFEDPVLNTFIHSEPEDLADLLFHELAHARVFAKGDTDFNEAFATAVGEEGARRWITARADAATRARYETELRRKQQFVRLVMRGRDQLKTVYGEESAHGRRVEPKPGSAELVALKRAQKHAVIEQLRRDYAQLKASWGGHAGYDHWFGKSLNNAQLSTVATYYELVPSLNNLLAKCGGDLEKFYAECKSLAKLTKEQRRAELKKFGAPALMTANP